MEGSVFGSVIKNSAMALCVAALLISCGGGGGGSTSPAGGSTSSEGSTSSTGGSSSTEGTSSSEGSSTAGGSTSSSGGSSTSGGTSSSGGRPVGTPPADPAGALIFSWDYSSATDTSLTGRAVINRTGTGYCAAALAGVVSPSVAAVMGAGWGVALEAGVAGNCTVLGLSPSTLYDFFFAALDASGNSETYLYQLTAATTAATGGGGAGAPAAPPAAPSILSTSPGDGSFTLTWTASDGATDYRITYNSVYGDGPSGYVNTGNVTTATVTGLINWVAYDINVAAIGPGGIFTESAHVATAGNGPITPPAITSVSAGANPGELVVSWTASPGARAYIVETIDMTSVLAQYPVSPLLTTYTITGLASGFHYLIGVRAVAPDGTMNQAAIYDPYLAP